MTFNDFSLDERILDAVARAGYETPSPIQEKALPPAIEGRDISACAQTGTGKTAAFALPILQYLAANPAQAQSPRTVRALILTPTRELAMQIHESFRTYGRYLKQIRCGLIMGGVSQYLQRDVLQNGADILVATPGRLLDYISQRLLSIGKIEIFVLDEADRMLDMGFIHDVRKVLACIPSKRQTMFFTATMPAEVQRLGDTILTRPVHIAVTPISSTTELTAQSVYFVDKLNKNELLVHLLKTDASMTSALIFTRTKYGADRLCRHLTREGISSMAIHGDKSQGQRQNALSSFKAGKIGVLVATDIAARGIDIEGLSHVINYELPNVAETYVHRIGRTGRAGKTGQAVSLCDYDEKEYLADIEKLIKKKVTVIDEHPYPMQIFVKSPPKVAQPRPQRRPPQQRR